MLVIVYLLLVGVSAVARCQASFTIVIVIINAATIANAAQAAATAPLPAC